MKLYHQHSKSLVIWPSNTTKNYTQRFYLKQSSSSIDHCIPSLPCSKWPCFHNSPPFSPSPLPLWDHQQETNMLKQFSFKEPFPWVSNHFLISLQGNSWRGRLHSLSLSLNLPLQIFTIPVTLSPLLCRNFLCQGNDLQVVKSNVKFLVLNFLDWSAALRVTPSFLKYSLHLASLCDPPSPPPVSLRSHSSHTRNLLDREHVKHSPAFRAWHSPFLSLAPSFPRCICLACSLNFRPPMSPFLRGLPNHPI